MDLDRLHGPHSVPLLLDTLADPRESTEVRIDVLRRLRDERLLPEHRVLVAQVILQLIADRSRPELRLQAVLALAEFADVEGVPTALGGLALDPDEPIDVRYSAFTSLQRAGPTTDCVALLRRLLTDEALGPCTRSVLSLWRLE